MRRFFFTVVIVILAFPLVGCPAMIQSSSVESFAGDGEPDSSPVAVPDDSSVLELVRGTLVTNQQTRTLSTDVHGAWQILHGVLAFGQNFEIQTPSGPQRAVEYLIAGGWVNGFEPRLGDSFDDRRRIGVRLEIQPTSKKGQGHRDQWLAILVQSGLTSEAILRVQGVDTRLIDWVDQAEFDVPLNLEYEFSWSLIALTAFRPTSHQWIARDGTDYSTELLLEAELSQNVENAVCGGTHRLIGIAMAVAKRKLERSPLTGVWDDAQATLNHAITAARQNQNPDGSYSTSYLHRSGWVRDLGESIGTTGHVLEFLAIAADDMTIREPWVERTVRQLCGSLLACEGIDLECGVLYHALHGLSLYEARLSERPIRVGSQAR